MSSLFSEAWRNLLTGTVRAGLLGTVFALTLSTLTVSDAVIVDTLVKEAQDFQEVGASTITVAAPAAISGDACEALSQTNGILASGAIRSTSKSLSLSVLPRSPVPISEVSAGFSAVLGVQPGSAGGVVVPKDVVLNSGGQDEEVLKTARGDVAVAGVYLYPSDGRRPGLGWAILDPIATGQIFDECWVKIWPWSDEIQSVLKGVVVAAGATQDQATQTTQGQLNAKLGTRFLGEDRYTSRVTRYAPGAALILGFALAAVSFRSRRLELAARRQDGFSRTDVTAQSIIETLAWVTPAALCAWAASTVYPYLVAYGTTVEGAGANPFIIAIAGVIGAVLGAGVTAAIVRERHLFAYFKDR